MKAIALTIKIMVLWVFLIFVTSLAMSVPTYGLLLLLEATSTVDFQTIVLMWVSVWMLTDVYRNPIFR
jgi:hypothetical protein